MAPAGVYISIPFCRQKCTYCNFASDVHPASSLAQYADALISEIGNGCELRSKSGIPVCAEQPGDTIYMGGGTPGMLPPEKLAEVVAAARRAFRMADNSEITIEASPENITPDTAAAWRALGINRVSMGVQSMVVEELRAVGRMHTAGTVALACEHLRAAGIHDISLDLIAGLPNQTAASWQRSLREVAALAPTHVSVYMLEVDDDSRLGRELLQNGVRYRADAVPTEDDIAAFYGTAIEMLQEAGFGHYEISNFARPGRESRHNMKYWSDAPYFGFGAGAHSYDGERRWENTESIAEFMDAIESGATPITAQLRLGLQQKLEERFFLGLRCLKGVALSRLSEEFDRLMPGAQPLRDRYAGPIREFCDAGWLETDGDCLRLTQRGLLFSNEVFAGFLEEQK